MEAGAVSRPCCCWGPGLLLYSLIKLVEHQHTGDKLEMCPAAMEQGHLMGLLHGEERPESDQLLSPLELFFEVN